MIGRLRNKIILCKKIVRTNEYRRIYKKKTTTIKVTATKKKLGRSPLTFTIKNWSKQRPKKRVGTISKVKITDPMDKGFLCHYQ